MKKVLIVDDEPNILRSLRFLMEQAGHAVSTLTDGADVFEQLENEPPDLLILDIMLPSLDGLTLCKQIRSTDVYDQMKILLLTAKGQDADIERGILVGADMYITKPFSIRDLVVTVERLF